MSTFLDRINRMDGILINPVYPVHPVKKNFFALGEAICN